MSSNAVQETSPPATANQTITQSSENYEHEQSLLIDGEMAALANEYQGEIFEWGSYSGTAHEVITRCPWARQVGAAGLRLAFESYLSQKPKLEEKEEQAEEPEIEETEAKNEQGEEVLENKFQIKTEKPEKIEPKKVRAEQETVSPFDNNTPDKPTVEMSFVEQVIPTYDVALKKPVATARRAENPAPSYDVARPVAGEESLKTAVPVEGKTVETTVENVGQRFESLVHGALKMPVAELTDAQVAEPLGKLGETMDKTDEVEVALSEQKHESAVELTEAEEEPIDFEFQIPPGVETESSEISSEQEGNFPVFQLPLENWSPLVETESDSAPENALYESPAPLEELETTLSQLAEKLDELEPEEAEAVHQILDEIAEIPRQLEISADGEVMNEQVIREELEEQFIELFERLGIEYSPELIEALVELVISQRLEEVKSIELADEEVELIPKEEGTHEFITQLLASVAGIRKALLQAYLLGKSALQLYRLQNAPTY